MHIYKTAQGRSALLLAIKALAKSNKKFIITQAYTCLAVPEAIKFAGYKPFWLDIELETFSIDIKRFKYALENYSDQFAAIFIQHTFGIIPKYYYELKDLAKIKGIPIIEDRCHCNFFDNYSYLKNKKTDEKIAYCYSFENAKPINLGRGGLVLLNNLSNKEINLINDRFKSFKKQTLIKSSIHLGISCIYKFFYNTIFYWPLLEFYRKLASFGFLPSNFKNNLDDFSTEGIGFFQGKIISLLLFITDSSIKNKNHKIYQFIYKIIIKKSRRFPFYVKSKEKAINLCKKRFIPVKDYFNTPIQPLKLEEYKLVNYKNHLCLKAEEASRHIISFDQLPPKKFLERIRNVN